MAEGEDRESGIHLTVPSEVEVRWPAFEALPSDLRATAELLAEGLSDEAIAARQGRPLGVVSSDVAVIYDRLSVAGRREIVRLRAAPLTRTG